jgi:hypothetical protein
MTCKICQHWSGDSYILRHARNQDGHWTGKCCKDPTPVETQSNYRCASVSVDLGNAEYWLEMMVYARSEKADLKEQLAKTKETLERVRARYRNLKGKP